jgi:hypothetical protein
VYAEPFAASGAYGPTGELIAREPTSSGPSMFRGTRDFNARSFRSNVVLRWEWKPGSTLFRRLAAESRRDRACRDARVAWRPVELDSLRRVIMSSP